MQSGYDVIVVGAGVGGAAFALALAHAYPLRILVVERRSGPGNINRGDSLLPTVTAYLAAWGVLDRFMTAGARPIAKMQVFHHYAGLLMEAPLASAPHPYLILPHPEIERVLAEAARATSHVEIRYNCRAARLLAENNRVCGLLLTNSAGDAEALSAPLVVGADGALSTVRAEMGIPLHRVPYNHSFFVLDVDRPEHYQDAMRIELHPSGGILMVPGLERVALAVLVHKEDEAVFHSGSLEEKLAAIRRRSPLLTACRAFPKGAHLYKLARGHAPRYTTRGAALLGDAVHVTNPTAGQGMTMAIEDAAALARHVGPALAAGERGARLEERLVAYERERWQRNAAVLRWSHWMSRFYALGGSLGDTVHRRVFAFGGSPLGRYVQHMIWSRVAVRKGL